LFTKVVFFRYRPVGGVVTYLTLGFSDRVLAEGQRGALRYELTLSCHESWGNGSSVQLLNFVAEDLAARGTLIRRGETIRPVGPITKGATVTGYYLTDPDHLWGGLAFWPSSDPPTRFIRLIPITSKEWRFIELNGAAAFEYELDRQSPDLYDFARPSLNLPEPRRGRKHDLEPVTLPSGPEIAAPSHDGILDHLRPFMGEPVRQKDFLVETDGQPLTLRVWEFRDRPVVGAMTFVTSGLSGLQLTREDGAIGRAELMFSCYEEWADIDCAYLLLAIVKYVLVDRAMPRQGKAITLTSPIVEGTGLTGLICYEPMYFDERLYVPRSTAPPTLFVWLVPLTSTELALVSKAGWPPLLDLLVEHDPELLDLERPSMDLSGARSDGQPPETEPLRVVQLQLPESE
jgi:hypothetical protein